MNRQQKKVLVAKKRKNMPKPANIQKDCRASREVEADRKKAIMLVKVVIVIDGPACLNPLTNLSSACKLLSV
jgi:hypothetical protein